MIEKSNDRYKTGIPFSGRRNDEKYQFSDHHSSDSFSFVGCRFLGKELELTGGKPVWHGILQAKRRQKSH